MRLAVPILAVVVVAALAASAVATAAHAAVDELTILYGQILRDPANTELNLRYAQLAEEQGKLRWALSAYERILLNDPGSVEGQTGLQRIRRKLQPNTTQYSAEVGAAFESNPLYGAAGKNPEAQLLASLSVKDDRSVGDLRWRTTGSVATQIHASVGDLNYGVVGAATGPVFNVLPDWALHTAVGGSAAYFDHHFYYGEATASATLEGYLEGAYRAVQVRGAYRDYNDFFPTTHGFYVDASGRFHFPDLLGNGTLVVLAPWVRWSEMGGTGLSPLLSDVQPGTYWEYGGRFEAFKGFAEWLVAGPTFTVTQRNYGQDIVPLTLDKRHDFLLIPGATVLFPNLLAYQTSLRVDYQFINDRSNDPAHSFTDHVITTSVVTRF